jgi:hypothetical protein
LVAKTRLTSGGQRPAGAAARKYQDIFLIDATTAQEERAAKRVSKLALEGKLVTKNL